MTLPVPELDYRPTVGAALRRAADRFGGRDFVVMPDRSMTFSEAEARSRELGKAMLETGLGKGSRVGLFFTYGPEFVVAWLAALRIGALVMPLSTIYRPAELRQVLHIGDVNTLLAPRTLLGRDLATYLEDAVPALSAHRGDGPLLLDAMPSLRSVWIDGGTDRAWARAVDLTATSGAPVGDALFDGVEDQVVPADLAQVTYTSGSSALPKGVVHSHGAIMRTTARFGEMSTAASPDAVPRILNGFPFFWIGGTLVLGGALHSGLALLCLERFEPEAALDLVEKARATSVAAWPSLIQSMRSHPTFAGRDLSSCPMLTAGPSDVALLNTPVPGIPAHRGMSETVGNWFGAECRVIDPSSGAVLPDMEEGELLVRGFGVMQGYSKKEREETFDADGWLHTGDRVFLHEGRPYFKGRFYEMIKSRGANVSPREVELALEGLPGVQHALVMGIPHPEFEEEVAAVVVPAPGRALDPVELERLAREQLSSFKVPTRWIVVAEEGDIPWLASGKPDKLALRDRLLAT
jgi:acyl-CoA synthetase (AMP-forming)/AMP-acid ligase II